jgi:diadenosine tetraphosphatase ApaH/serine/threonine PP2A family protein phosphatase
VRRTAIISDIHGNLHALDAVMDAIGGLGSDRIVCLGDIVGYGARPAECVARVREACETVLLGNHDAVACGKSPPDHFNPVARAAIEWTREELSGEDTRWLAALPLVHREGALTLTHATVTCPEEWEYVLSPIDAAVEIDACDTALLFYGHTHHPYVFTRRTEGADRRRVRDLELVPGERCMINVGSVGQPRDGDPDACFLLLDERARRIEYHRIPYDIEATQREILAAGIPRELATRLSFGR